MPDNTQLPYLLQLLDDESEEVQKEVSKKLFSYGPRLKKEIWNLPSALVHSREHVLNPIVESVQRTWLRENWPSWFNISADFQRLETALSLLAEFQSGIKYHENLPSLLNRLAQEYTDYSPKMDPFRLAKFLFEEKGLKGDEANYYHPQNSNLIYTIVEKRGLPISLSCVYILVGSRLAMSIEGCNFPGHFMARFEQGNKRFLVDCFNGGKIIDEKDIVELNFGTDSLKESCSQRAEPDDIIRRFLTNLIRAYHLKGEINNQQCMIDLFNELDRKEIMSQKFPYLETHRTLVQDSMFRSGQLVRHKRYGYRGLIVDHDLQCEADDEWYFSNQTQPRRNQPWYHVLVHGAEHVTYVAESNLISDESNKDVEHPLIDYFFERAKDGRYIRNDSPWPKEEY